MRKLIALIGLMTLPLIGIITLSGQTQYEPCPGTPIPRLSVGGQATVTGPFTTVRNDIAGEPIRTVEANEDLTFDIMAGPYCYGVYNWWEVSAGEISGFVAEGTGLIYWLAPVTGDDEDIEFGTGGRIPTDLPTDANITAEGIPAGIGPGLLSEAARTDDLDEDCIGAPPARLTVGLPGRVAQSYSNIREEIGSSTVIDTMYRFTGDAFVVLAGPICAGPHFWWQVEHNGVIGWVTEGTGFDYWLVPAVEG